MLSADGDSSLDLIIHRPSSLRWTALPHDPTGEPGAEPDRTVGPCTPVVMLHGFTQNGRCLGPLAEQLAMKRPVLSPDLPGHGSAASRAGEHPAETTRRLVRQTEAATVRPHWFGYSMGGRLALQLALDHPGAVRSLVLLGATAGIPDAAEREERALLDERRARRIESVGVPQFCAEWLDAPMFAGLPGWAHFTAERNSNTVAGLAGSLRLGGTGSMKPMWERLGSMETDVLLIVGARDDKFTRVAADMAEAIGPNARVSIIEGAGHAAHLEAPDATAAVVAEFLETAERD